MKQILEIRAQTEGLSIDSAALDQLSKIGSETSLRYVVQLLTPARILAQSNGRAVINGDDITEANTLFLDAKSSARILAEHQDKYLM